MSEYIISDVSKLLGIEPHVLRYWEEELGLEVTRNKLGHRYYDDQDLEILKKIKEFKVKGYQLKAIKIVLENDIKKEKISHENQASNLQKMVDQREADLAVYSEALPQNNNKLEQFQDFMKSIIVSTLKDNNNLLLEDIRTEVKNNLYEVIDRQEALDEKRYRKLDETIREMQKMRQEAAVTTHQKKQKRSFMKKRISP